MANSKRPIAISDDLRGRLQGRIDDLINSGDFELPPGKRIRLDRTGVARLVEASTPTMSAAEIRQIYRHTDDFPLTRHVEWGVFNAELDELLNGKKRCTGITPADLLRSIETVQKHVVEDFEALVGLSQELEDFPDHIKNTKFAVNLTRIICRILNELPERGAKVTEDDIMNMWINLKKYRRGFYVLVDHIRQCHRDARANPDHQRHFGEAAAACLQTLVTAMASWDPRNDMDHEVFRSLKERVDGIRRGNREASPEVGGDVDDGTEDGTEDGAED